MTDQEKQTFIDKVKGEKIKWSFNWNGNIDPLYFIPDGNWNGDDFYGDSFYSNGRVVNNDSWVFLKGFYETNTRNKWEWYKGATQPISKEEEFFNKVKGKKIHRSDFTYYNYVIPERLDGKKIRGIAEHVNGNMEEDCNFIIYNGFTETKGLFGDMVKWEYYEQSAGEMSMPKMSFNGSDIGTTTPKKSLTQSELWKEEGKCPKCGEYGRFIGFQLSCSKHGIY